MRFPQDYDSELLVDAITALDYSKDAARAATRAVQKVIKAQYGELDEEDAVWILGSLLNRRLIRAQVQSDAAQLISKAGSKVGVKARYVRIR